ncbi:MAG: hypothetical protein M3O03_15175 [Pseudomonadota bacterium]|nr:hypothetical protein [Pseudomonadota bacterium]
MHWHRNSVAKKVEELRMESELKVSSRKILLSFLVFVTIPMFASTGFAGSAPKRSSHGIVGKCYKSVLIPSEPKSEYKILCFRSDDRGLMLFMDPSALDGFDDVFVYAMKKNALRIKIGELRSQHCKISLERSESSFILSGCQIAGRWVEAMEPFVHK